MGQNPFFKVARNFKKRDRTNFHPDTIQNIEEGQKFLSLGVVSGCRNPVSHEEVADLKALSSVYRERLSGCFESALASLH